jgi:two-component system CheB/CheR fusion protein
MNKHGDGKDETEPKKSVAGKKGTGRGKKPAAKAAPSSGRKATHKREPHPPERKVFPVVGIGASAGGLEPLEAFFATMPPDKPDMAFVVIQHLSPQHKSIIGEILKKDTDMPIKEIRNGMALEPNTIYFNPPDQEVGIHRGGFN